MNLSMKYLLAFILCTLSIFSVCFKPAFADSTEQPAPGEMIRIAILKGYETITVNGKNVSATDEKGRNLQIELPARLRNEYDRVKSDKNAVKTIRLSSPELLQVNGKSYRGVIEISPLNGKLLVVDELPLEDYLVGVINSEISSTWPMEAIKTQAVIARTFAVAKRDERKKSFYHLESTIMDQVYEGSDEEDSRAARGVHETEGYVLSYNGKIIQAFYHANSGGRTESSENVWGKSLPYLKGVECQYSLTSTTSRWELSIPLAKIESALKGFKIYGLNDIKAGQLNNRGRLKTVILVTDRGNISIPATKFRMAIGSTVIKSTNFIVRVEGGMAYFNGSGYGHGVGLCQYGAKQRAIDGFSFDEILSYYYPGTKLSKLSDLK